VAVDREFFHNTHDVCTPAAELSGGERERGRCHVRDFFLSITDDCKKISGQVCIRVWDDGSHTYVSEPAAVAKMNCLACYMRE